MPRALRASAPVVLAVACVVAGQLLPAGGVRDVVVLPAVLLGPGYCLLRACDVRLPAAAEPIVWAVVSVAICSLLAVIVAAVGLRIEPVTIAVPLGVGMLASLPAVGRRGLRSPADPPRDRGRIRRVAAISLWLVFCVGTVAAVASRLPMQPTTAFTAMTVTRVSATAERVGVRASVANGRDDPTTYVLALSGRRVLHSNPTTLQISARGRQQASVVARLRVTRSASHEPIRLVLTDSRGRQVLTQQISTAEVTP